MKYLLINLLLGLLSHSIYGQKPTTVKTTITITVFDEVKDTAIIGATVYLDIYHSSLPTNDAGDAIFDIELSNDLKASFWVAKEGFQLSRVVPITISDDDRMKNSHVVKLSPTKDLIIHGQIIDKMNQNVIGANVVLKIPNGRRSFKSNEHGTFTFNIPPDSIVHEIPIEISMNGCEFIYRNQIVVPCNRFLVQPNIIYECNIQSPKQCSINVNEIVDSESGEGLDSVKFRFLSNVVDTIKSYPHTYVYSNKSSSILIEKNGYESINLNLANLKLDRIQKPKKNLLKNILSIATPLSLGGSALTKHIAAKKYEEHLDFNLSDSERRQLQDISEDWNLAANILGGFGIAAGITWVILPKKK